MASVRQPGPLCQVNNPPVALDDGTLCRCASPLPGTVDNKPEMLDNFAWPIGVDASKSLGEEAWFEHQYPNLLEDARLKFVDFVNQWVQNNWGSSPLKDKTPRISVSARDISYGNADGSTREVKKSDNRFERCGDIPQTPHEADKVLGAFSIDLETPITITYSARGIAGKKVEAFDWTAIMYVEDVLGLQADNQVVHKLGRWTLVAAPSRRVKRARWKIGGEHFSYVVVAGDSLSKIALALCKDMQKWKDIYDANRGKIADPNRLFPGQRIFIPASLVKS